jgi:cysteine synthase A
VIAEMRAAGRTGSVVTLICDGGERYADTYYSDAWVADQRMDLAPHLSTIETFFAAGTWS